MGPHVGLKMISWMIRFGQRTTTETVKRIMGREGPDIYFFLKSHIYVFKDFFVEYHRLSGSCMVNN